MQDVGATDRCAVGPRDSQVHVPGCRKRFEEPSSSSHEDPKQIYTTPRNARFPEDTSKTGLEQLASESGTVPGWTHQNKMALVGSRLTVSEKNANARGRVLQPHHSLQGCGSCCRVLRLVVVAVASVCGVCVCGILPCGGWRGTVCSPTKNMRKDRTIWKLMKAIHGTQVVSSPWQKLVRETLCDGHWRVLTCVPCCFRH